MSSFIPPQNFGMVETDLFRSGQPNELNFPFIEKLHLRTVINLAPDELPPALLTWLEEQRVELVHLGEDVGKRSPWKPVSEEMVLEGLHVLLNPSSFPVLVMCNFGRHRTGTIIGCLRKLQGWSLSSILEEYRRHAGSKFRQLNEQFIELFDTDLVPLPPRRPLFMQEVPASSSGGARRKAGATEQGGGARVAAAAAPLSQPPQEVVQQQQQAEQHDEGTKSNAP
jgi:tyrosine-protein phosphatase OCA1